MVCTRVFNTFAGKVCEVVIEHFCNVVTVVHTANRVEWRVIHRLIPTEVVVSFTVVVGMVYYSVVCIALLCFVQGCEYSVCIVFTVFIAAGFFL